MKIFLDKFFRLLIKGACLIGLMIYMHIIYCYQTFLSAVIHIFKPLDKGGKNVYFSSKDEQQFFFLNLFNIPI